MYVTLTEFKQSPVHGIDTSQLVPGGTTADNDAALTAIIEAAISMVNDKCEVITFEASTPTETVVTYLTRRGDLIVRPRNIPTTSVTSVAYRTHPSQAWTTIDLSNVDVMERSFTVRSLSLPTIGGIAVSDVYATYLTPSDMDRLSRLPVSVKFTYASGYATVPRAIKTATIMYAAALIGERGNVEVDMDGNPSATGGLRPRFSYGEAAEALLRPYRKVAL